MDFDSTQINTKYQPVTVDVPEERLAEFHAFFARFLTGRPGRGPRGRHGRPHRHPRGRHCAGRREAIQHDQDTSQPTEISEV